MTIIGITGGIASGKSTIANILAKKLNAQIIDADKIAKEILFATFGKIDTKKLAKVVFNNKEELIKLNNLIHPKVMNRIEELVGVAAHSYPNENEYIIMDVPIPTKQFKDLSNFTIVAVANNDIRIERKTEAKERIGSQLTNDEYIKFADRIIVNNGTIEELENAINKIDFGIKKIGFYPGSFDPFTNGHLDILKKACTHYDKVIVGMGTNELKNHRFPNREEMKSTIKKTVGVAAHGYPNVDIIIYDNLTVETAIACGATQLLRGIRNEEEYKREDLLRTYNKDPKKILKYLKDRNLPPKILPCGLDTKFFYPTKGIEHISSTLVMEKYENREDISDLVPKEILEYINKRGALC